MAFGVYTMFPFTMLSNVEGRSFFLMFRAYAFLLPSINDSSFSSSAADILLTDEIVSSGVP